MRGALSSFPTHIHPFLEVKAVERLNVNDEIAQALEDAGDKIPVVAHKRNGRDFNSCFPVFLSDFLLEENSLRDKPTGRPRCTRFNLDGSIRELIRDSRSAELHSAYGTRAGKTGPMVKKDNLSRLQVGAPDFVTRPAA